MAGLNKVMLIGHLGKDPEITYSSSGLAICKFSLATSEKKKNSNGEWESHTDWHKITIFGKTAEFAEQFLSKGSQVYIEGKLSYGNYERDGVKHYTTDIICNNMTLLGKRGSGEDGASEKSSSGSNKKSSSERNYASNADESYESEPEEDLPF